MYRKPAFTGILLHFNSMAPFPKKRGLIICLLHRAYSYSSNDLLLKTEINFIISLFKRNGYPIPIILNVIDRLKNKVNNYNRQFPAVSPNNTPNSNPYFTLPYIGIPSNKFGKRIATLFRDRLGANIKTAIKLLK